MDTFSWSDCRRMDSSSVDFRTSSDSDQFDTDDMAGKTDAYSQIKQSNTFVCVFWQGESRRNREWAQLGVPHLTSKYWYCVALYTYVSVRIYMKPILTPWTFSAGNEPLWYKVVVPNNATLGTLCIRKNNMRAETMGTVFSGRFPPAFI